MDTPNRKYMSYNGGCALAQILKDKESFWISKKEWEEHGESIFLKK